MAAARNDKLLDILEKNWQAEINGACTYETLAGREDDLVRKKSLLHLAEAERTHAALWAQRIRQMGGEEPVYHGKATGDADSIVNKLGGSDMALRRLEIDESRDIARYSQQLKGISDEPSLAILRRALITIRSWWSSGLEMTLVGAVEGVVTYFIGIGLGTC